VPGWDSKDFEQQCAAWVAELRKRQHFDLRPWHDHGEEALREAAVQERMGKLNRQIVQTITRGERAEKSLGNVDAHNPHFIGRTANLRMLRENFVKPGHIGVVTTVNGVGGLGKTALAIEYAHAFADEYGGGRWQVRCAGKDDLRLALAELATPIGFEFTDDEKKNADLQFERVRLELKKLADAREPHRCLLILDNVDRPGLLDPAPVARLNGGDWLHVLATTRLGENELHGAHRDRSFLAVDELPRGGEAGAGICRGAAARPSAAAVAARAGGKDVSRNGTRRRAGLSRPVEKCYAPPFQLAPDSSYRCDGRRRPTARSARSPVGAGTSEKELGEWGAAKA